MKVLDVYYTVLFILLSIFNSFLVGNRDLYIGKDTANYYNFYYDLSLGQVYSGFSDPLFILLTRVIVYFNLSFNSFLIIISFLSSFILLFSYYKIIKGVVYNKTYIAPLILATINLVILSPFYWGTQINIIRIGLSIPLVFLSVIYFSCNKNKLGVIFIVLSSLIHVTNIQFLIIFFLFSVLYKRIPKIVERSYLKAYILIVIGYLLSINQYVTGLLPLDLFGFSDYNSYLDDGSQNLTFYEAGVRYDFASFTLLFVMLLFGSTKRIKNTYIKMFFYYSSLLTVPFFLLGYIPFSDRLLSAFWMLIPLIIVLALYSYLKPRYVIKYLSPLLIIFLIINYYFSISIYLSV